MQIVRSTAAVLSPREIPANRASLASEEPSFLRGPQFVANGDAVSL